MNKFIFPWLAICFVLLTSVFWYLTYGPGGKYHDPAGRLKPDRFLLPDG